MSAVECEWFAVRSLREWLALKLPICVGTVNATRYAQVKTPTPGGVAFAGPFSIPVGAVLKISTTARSGSFTNVTLTSGSRTTAQLVTEISASIAGIATADTSSRLVLTSQSNPVVGTPSVIAIGEDTTGANTALGWPAGGTYDERSAIQSPSFEAIMDGEPLQPDPGLFAAGGLIIMFDSRSSAPRSQNVRDDMYWVDLDLALFFIEPNQQIHRNREPIHACLRAVRECLLTDLGRVGGGEAPSTSQAICKVIEKSARVGGQSIGLRGMNLPNALMDIAQLKLGVLVFERPSATAP